MYEVRVTPIENENSRLIGLATIVVDGKFAFSGIKLLATDNPIANKGRGYNVVMPSYKNGYGEYIDFFKPVSKELHDQLAYAIHASLNSGDVISLGSKESQVTVRVKENHYGNVWATATIAFNKEFVCDTVQVRENKNGELFVAYPSYKTNKLDEKGMPEYKNVCNPITKEFKNELDSSILEKIPVKSKSINNDFADSAQKVQHERKYSSKKM